MNAAENSGPTGGCACGAVRFRLEAAPLVVHACHCKNCQRQTGAWHAVNALLESHLVTLLRGELVHQHLSTPSGAGQSVTRCALCQTAVWSNYHSFSRGHGDIVRFVRVGTLDEAWRLPPDVHIYTADRNSSAPEPVAAPRYEAFYDLPEVWAQESLRRISALYPPTLPGLHAATHANLTEHHP